MRTRVAIIGALLLFLAAAYILAQNGNTLFQQALVKQTVNGDIPGAIKEYQRIVEDFPADRALVAQTLFQLGKCYDSMRQPDKARQSYEQVVNKYPEQTKWVNEAKGLLADIAKTVFQIATPPTEDSFGFAISPDGRSVVFAVTTAGRGQLWLHNLTTGKASPISGAEISSDPTPFGFPSAAPFWSPDSKAIGYFTDGKLKRIAPAGGTAKTLASVPNPEGGTWNQNGIILFGMYGEDRLFRVAANGSTSSVPLGMKGLCPVFLPDGQHFLFYQSNTAANLGQVSQTLYIGSLGSSESRQLTVQAHSGTIAAPDQLLYTTDQGVFAQRLDMKTLQLTGSPSRVSEPVPFKPPFCFMPVSTSVSGVLTYRTADSPAERQLVWLDRQGRQTQAFPPDSALPCCARISPDGISIVYGRDGSSPAGGVWLTGDRPGVEARLLVSGAKIAAWSPMSDGLAIGLFRAQAPNGPRITLRPLKNGGLNGQRDESPETPTDWSKDGRLILYETRDNVMVVPLLPSRNLPPSFGDPIPVAQTAAIEKSGRFSSDGKWIAYQSNEAGGRNEIFVQPFPGSPDSRRRVSLNGGASPAWSTNNGGELYFLGADSRLMVVPVKFSNDGQNMELGVPVPLFNAALPAGSEYDVSADGQRFLVNRLSRAAETATITVLRSWTRAK